jgi:hypothetical protein
MTATRLDESMIGEENVTDAIDEAMARAICAAGGIDPDALNGAAGVVWKLYLPDARAARSAHLAALERAGWRCVPVEPTDEMCDAATRSTSAWLNSKLQGVALRRLKLQIRWRAMLAAAPPPQNSDEVKP